MYLDCLVIFPVVIPSTLQSSTPCRRTEDALSASSHKALPCPRGPGAVQVLNAFPALLLLVCSQGPALLAQLLLKWQHSRFYSVKVQ